MARFIRIIVSSLAIALMGTTVALAHSGSGTQAAGTTTAPSQGDLLRTRPLKGRVTAVDPATRSFSLQVRKAPRSVAIDPGAVVRITTDANTRYKLRGGFDGITVGRSYKVHVRTAADGTLVAVKVQRAHRGRHRHGFARFGDDRRGDPGHHRGKGRGRGHHGNHR